MYGCVLTPPVSPQAQVGVLFMHNEGYSTMCGHGVIGLVTVLLEIGHLPITAPHTVVTLDTPAGIVQASAHIRNGRVADVAFANVASFVYADRTVTVPTAGDVPVTVAYGGAFYVLVDAQAAGLGTQPGPLASLVSWSEAVKAAVGASLDVIYPTQPEIRGLYGVVTSWPPRRPDAQRTSLTVFADGQVDRSPCGTCPSALMAALWASGRLKLGEPFVNESLAGTRFTGRLLEATRVGDCRAVVPEVTGQAAITGFHTFVLDPNDPLPDGFLLR